MEKNDRIVDVFRTLFAEAASVAEAETNRQDVGRLVSLTRVRDVLSFHPRGMAYTEHDLRYRFSSYVWKTIASEMAEHGFRVNMLYERAKTEHPTLIGARVYLQNEALLEEDEESAEHEKKVRKAAKVAAQTQRENREAVVEGKKEPYSAIVIYSEMQTLELAERHKDECLPTNVQDMSSPQAVRDFVEWIYGQGLRVMKDERR